MATKLINMAAGGGASAAGWTDFFASSTSPVDLGDGWSFAYDVSAVPDTSNFVAISITPSGDALWVGTSGDVDIYKGFHQANTVGSYRKVLISGPASTSFTLDLFSTFNATRTIEARLNGGATQTLLEYDGAPNDSQVLTFSGSTDGSGGATFEYAPASGSGFAHATAIRLTTADQASLTLDQATLTPGGTISGTYANYTTTPTTLEGIRGSNVISSAGASPQITGLNITPDADPSSGTFTATIASLPTTGTLDFLRFSDSAQGVADPTWRLS